MNSSRVQQSLRALGSAMGAIILLTSLTDPGKASDCSKTSTGFIPLNELGMGSYKGTLGGLYLDGSNERPAEHDRAGLALARTVLPLDSQGKSSPQGRIVRLSIGMSNTTQEFSMFRDTANADPEKNPRLTIVDGAQGGMSADRIVNPSDGSSGTQYWNTVGQRLAMAGVTAGQVQVAWVKQADAGPTQSFPADARRLQAELTAIAQILKSRFPNIKLAYYSSRIYGGYASTNLNPEPFAYQSGFAVKWMIEDQINGAPELNFDPLRGQVRAPWLAWGPYLWADGLKARGDGLRWECSDFADDGTHPGITARRKVTDLLLKFFKTDATARVWFLAAP